MKTQIYLICLVAGLLGQAFHIGLKIVQLSKRAKAANTTFKVSQYFMDDLWPTMLNILALLITLFILEDIAKWQPVIMEYFKFFFIAIGYMGSSLLSAVLSNADKRINKIVDRKTDIADGKE